MLVLSGGLAGLFVILTIAIKYLSLLVGLVFRKQDFRDIGFEAQKKIVSHFGPLHVHGWAPHPGTWTAHCGEIHLRD